MSFLIAFLFVAVAVTGYYTWLHTYWKRKGISGPRGLPFLGSFYELADVNNPRVFIIRKWAKKFGKVFGFYEGATPVLVVGDPDMLQELFIKKFENFNARKTTNYIHGDLENEKEEPLVNVFFSQGNRWKKLRALNNPALSVKSLRLTHDNMENSVICMVDMFSKHEDGKPFNIHETAVGTKYKEWVMFNLMVALKNNLQLENVKLGIENPPADFIDMFLEYYSETLKNCERPVKIDILNSITGSVFAFLVAGYDTTANTLAYACHMLMKHPEKMEKAQKEIDEICTSENISYDDMSKLKYVDAIIKETLRLFPVGWFACSRQCVTPTTLGKYYIDAGVRIEADVGALHLDKEIWGENAEDFVPERWFDSTSRHTMSWIPFGAGPRQCVGMRLGLAEAKTTLAHVLKKYTLYAGPETEKELKYQGCATISPEKVTVYLKNRF
uniref:Cytochrome P450 n=1 Tax=Caenorhabditis tropicalis TaxID=1561998 RepID=A0A1I7TRP5_9PELO